jgi:Mn2+/Fe2+ NRAMP family transporter
MGKHKLQGEKHSVKRSLFMVLGLLGPGLVAALADNDAGGVISYAVTGAKFGVGLFIPLTLLMVLITYTVQEMAMRLGVVAEDSYNTLVKQKYGKFWMIYQLLSLVVENFITLMTEFIGMSAGLVILGLPMWAAVLIGLVLVLAIALFRGYATKEKIAVGVGCLNIVFIIIA